MMQIALRGRENASAFSFVFINNTASQFCAHNRVLFVLPQDATFKQTSTPNQVVRIFRRKEVCQRCTSIYSQVFAYFALLDKIKIMFL